jgi:hypothetical protein
MFEGARIWTILLTDAPLELPDAIVLVLLHPLTHFALEHRDVADAATQEHRAKHRHIGAGHEHLESVGGPMNSACRRKIRSELLAPARTTPLLIDRMVRAPW